MTRWLPWVLGLNALAGAPALASDRTGQRVIVKVVKASSGAGVPGIKITYGTESDYTDETGTLNLVRACSSNEYYRASPTSSSWYIPVNKLPCKRNTVRFTANRP